MTPTYPMEPPLSPKRLVESKRRPAQKQEKQIRAAIPRLQKVVRDLQRQHDELDVDLAVLSLARDAPPEVQLTERHAQLKIQLKEAQDDLAAHVICLSWALRLPVEVVEKILILCLPEDQYITPKRRTAPLLLCQICSMWRNVAVVTPALWHRLALELSRPRGGWKELLETWFGRSGNALLHFSLVPPSSLFSEVDMAYFDEHIVKCLSRYSERWKRLRLQAPPHSLRALVKNRMPNLKILELRVDENGPLEVFIPSAPRLVQLNLSENTDPIGIHVPWQQLTALRVKRPLRWDKSLLLLAKCRQLRECQITLSDDAAGGVVPPLCMPHLCHVVLSGSFGKDATDKFFDAAEFPQLETLQLVQAGPGTLCLNSSFANFARRSPGLVKLTVKIGDIAVKGLHDTVDSIPSLKEVVLIDGYNSRVPIRREGKA
ncbi:hypothetical protein FB45DRAFT_782649 [Roridomyces roridus]|uniref:F-box domain-containing protein n=1 Tax=Roridomyces roridus TaxID=1738132 RepID=A0AAD7CFZ5_9AGAR|nr:hypothetical protein FB45DRAFT_782649 [Roridomyces roridus]